MTPELQALARRAVACPRWRWMPGMLALPCSSDHSGLRGIPVRVVHVYEGGDGLVVWGGVYSERGSWEEWRWREEGRLPDLTDPATLGCLVALVREIHGPSAVARHIGTNGRGGQEWAIYDRAPPVDGYHVAAPALGYWESEAEALVAALETGGGGV